MEFVDRIALAVVKIFGLAFSVFIVYCIYTFMAV